MKRLIGAAAVSVLLAGCGGAAPADLSSSAAAVLQRDADAIARAARSGNGTAVQAALAVLRRDVAAQQKSGDVSAARAQRVLAAGAVLATDVPVPKPAPVVTRAPVATSPSPEHRERGKGKGDGEKHGD